MSTAIAALPFFGGTLACFDPGDSTVVEVTSPAYVYDSTWSTSALQVIATYARSPSWSSASTFWAHWVINYALPFSGVGDSDTFYFLNGATVVAKVTVNDLAIYTSGTFKLWTLQSGVMTLVGTATVPIQSVRQTFDVKLVGGAAGSAAMYIAGTLAFSVGSLNHTAWAGITQIQLNAGLIFSGSGAANWSQVICDTSSTVGRFLRTDRLNTNSATNTGWTGSVTDINEIPTSDANFISAASANLVSTFFENGLNLGTYQILARGVGARFRAEDVSGPQNLQLAIRSGSSNFFSASIAATTGFQAAFNSWTTDPNTSSAWTDAAAASAESGVKSIT